MKNCKLIIENWGELRNEGHEKGIVGSLKGERGF